MKQIILSLLLSLISLGISAQEKVNFSDSFKKKNQGRYKVEINEMKELLHIMIAITNSGLQNDDMIQQEGAYYQDVIKHFEPYKNEDIIQTFDSLMVSSIYNYLFLVGNAITYEFKGHALQKSDTFLFTAMAVAGQRISENPIATYSHEIEDFAKKSNFRKFFKAHKAYYAEIVASYEKNANLGKQWKWLESNFETRINSYVIYCSPLVNSLNYTGEFDNNGFRLIHMNLPPLDNFPSLSALENEIFNTRVMFTEIDHNYVSAPSQAHSDQINTLFKSRQRWVDEQTYGTSAYPTPIKVFDEYMTYAVFLLYVKANYEDGILKQTQKELTELMGQRGFPKMKEFGEALLNVSAANKCKNIDQWYPEFLEQLEKQ